MRITEEEKKDILSKYEGNTSDEVLTYLKRNFPYSNIQQPEWMDRPIKMISIDDKSYWVEGNKKFLVNRISSILSEKWIDLESSILRRTVKKYIDGILSSE